MESPAETASNAEKDYFSRREALHRRVAEAARALADRGIAPTVARVRAALGGGSPNDLAPALKHWKESFAAVVRPGDRTDTPALPVPIADLAHELWQRATIAAAVELKGGPAALALTTRTEEAESLRQQVTTLRNQLERESVMYGELRAQAARHEAIAREAISRVEDSEARERKYLRDLGSTRQRVAELEATVTQLRARPTIPPRSRRQSTLLTTAHSSKRSPRRKTAAARARPVRPPAQRRAPKRTPPPRVTKTRTVAPARPPRHARQTRRPARIKPRPRP